MGNAEGLGHAARIVDVAAGAAGALPVGRGAVVVELERDADDVVALALQQAGHHRGIDAARHGDDDARLVRRLRKIERVHGRDGARAGRREGASGPGPRARVCRVYSDPGSGLSRDVAAGRVGKTCRPGGIFRCAGAR